MNIKEHFTSRWEDGVLIEADWSQIEVRVFAFLTQDYTLMDDIKKGVDIHKVMYAKAYGVPESSVTSQQRSGIKACTFHVIYGGGAKSMAKRMNLDEEFCKTFIEAFYDRYPTARLWQDNLVRQVEGNKYLIDEYTDTGLQKHEGYLKSCTGRKYYFKTSDTPDFLRDKGILTGFNPPEIKNYPVQGLATADIHMIALGNLFRKLLPHRDKCLLVNTVHDSVIVDCKKIFTTECCKIMKHGLLDIVRILEKEFNIDFDVPLDVEFKVGRSWAEMTKVEVK